MPPNPKNPKPRRETDRHVLAFETWYTLAGKDFTETCRQLRLGKMKISVDTLYRWAKAYDWESRARERDEAVAKARFDTAIKEKEGMLTRHLGIARLLQNQAVLFLQPPQPQVGQVAPQTRVSNVNQALAAIRLGVEMERMSAGLPSWLVNIMNAGDDELQTLFESALATIGIDTTGDGKTGVDEKSFPSVAVEPLSKDDGGA